MHIHKQIHVHINSFKATKDIAAGQEILVQYGSVNWFLLKNIPYADVDYASTMWRPDLHPLPCRQRVAPIAGADGRHCYAVAVDTIPSGTVVEISLCLAVSAIVIDQFPYLWDFVLIGETENEYTGRQQTSASPRAHTACVFVDQDEGNIGERAERVLYFSFSHSLSSNTHTHYDPKPSRPYDFGVGVRVLRPYRPES